jgi:hypothetical protein
MRHGYALCYSWGSWTMEVVESDQSEASIEARCAIKGSHYMRREGEAYSAPLAGFCSYHSNVPLILCAPVQALSAHSLIWPFRKVALWQSCSLVCGASPASIAKRHVIHHQLESFCCSRLLGSRSWLAQCFDHCWHISRQGGGGSERTSDCDRVIGSI